MRDYNEVFRFTGTPLRSPGLTDDTGDCLVIKGWLVPRDDLNPAAVLPFPTPDSPALSRPTAQLWKQAG